jgi:hypothetical protein
MIARYFKYFLPLLAFSLTIGCKKKIDDAYINPNATVRVPVETLLPGIIGNMVGSSAAAGSAYGLANDGVNIGRYVQYWGANVSGNQFDQMGGATGVSDAMGSVWAMHYFGMGQNLTKMIEWGEEEKKWDYVGVGHAIRAFSWLRLTTEYGEVIVDEAFNTSLQTFKYDEQEKAYAKVRSHCYAALANLNRTGDNASQANLAKGDEFFYNGDVNKWKKFTYAVLALSYHHLTNKASQYQADSVIHYTNLAMSSNADNATAKFANTGITGTSNFYGPLRANVGTLRQSAYIANLMTGLNPTFNGVMDPRVAYLLRENNNGTYRGVTVGLGSTGLAVNDQPRNFWGGTYAQTTSTQDTASRYIFGNAAEFPIFTASEMQFVQAEAKFRKGDKAGALAAYRNAISLNFDMLTTTYNRNIPTNRQITQANKDAYLNNPLVVPTNPASLTLSQIMLQKYIALYGWGVHETWVDMRRYHYLDIDPATGQQVYNGFTPPSGINLFVNNNNRFVYRARPRYNSEYLYNIPELERIGALALDYHTMEQWFSKN